MTSSERFRKLYRMKPFLGTQRRHPSPKLATYEIKTKIGVVIGSEKIRDKYDKY